MLHILSKHNKLPVLWHIPVHVREKKNKQTKKKKKKQKRTPKPAPNPANQKIQLNSSSYLIRSNISLARLTQAFQSETHPSTAAHATLKKKELRYRGV